jgi:hypothetical protein
MIGLPLAAQIKANNCSYTYWNAGDHDNMTNTCDVLYNQMKDMTQTLNFYDLYRYTEADDLDTSLGGHNMHSKFGQINPRFKNDFRRIPTNPFKEDPGEKVYSDNSTTMSSFLKDQEVRTALHIPSSVREFTECVGDYIDPEWVYTVQPEASEWIYTLLKN